MFTTCRDNVWPEKALPELQPAFLDLGRHIVETGQLVAWHIDRCASSSHMLVTLEGESPPFSRIDAQAHILPHLSAVTCASARIICKGHAA